MSNWYVEPTVFTTLDEIKEAMKFGYLNYCKEGSLGSDGAFGYKDRTNSLPTLFYGGGEDDRPNHQPMVNGEGNFVWREYTSHLAKAKLWSEIREQHKPKEWYEEDDAFPCLCWVRGAVNKHKDMACVINGYNGEFFHSNKDGLWSNATPVTAEDLCMS